MSDPLLPAKATPGRRATETTARGGIVTAALATLLLVRPVAAPAQDARQIMTEALEAYESRMSRVSDYTVTQEVMGIVTTNHFVRRESDGRPVFVSSDADPEDPTPEGWGNPYRLFPELAERATLEGRDTVDGHAVWKVGVADFEGLELEAMGVPGAETDFQPERALFYLDTADHVIHRVTLEGTMTSDGRSGPLSMDARFRDYRDVEGMLHPFRVEMSVEGMGMALTEAQLEQARQALETMRSQLEAMPEERRALAREALGPQMEQIQQMLETGVLELTLVVRSLSVNDGPPGAEEAPGAEGPPG